jgi:ubiquitin carboxyl-terminal hydrolase 25
VWHLQRLTEFHPGKLAPVLVEDLHIYDPRYTPANGLNVLRDVPLFYSGHNNVAALLPQASCRHSWCAKDNQQVLPALDARPSRDSIYKFAGVCRKCRMHVVLEVDYTVNWEPEPCPNSTHPLHHLVHSPRREGIARSEGVVGRAKDNIGTLAFECSSPTCSAAVFVRLTPPLLSDDHVRLLTDRALLSQRADEVIGLEPARFEGHRKPTAVDVLSDLRSYMKHSLEHKESRPIKVDNKRFTLRFGIDGREAKDVLTFLGFKYEVRFYSLQQRIG